MLRNFKTSFPGKLFSTVLSLEETQSLRFIHNSRFLGQTQANEPEGDENLETRRFKALELTKAKLKKTKRPPPNQSLFKRPRELSQVPTQDWGSVWPAARSFQPSTIPLPIFMGRKVDKLVAPPSKYASNELMKIPNFFHLTPSVVERQCAALKQFCTKYPEELKDPHVQKQHLPVVITKYTYVKSAPSIRDPRARVVHYEFHLDSLGLDDHGKDKILRMVNEYYKTADDLVTLVIHQCPLSDQNVGFCKYLATVLYFESLKTESWEQIKTRLDNEMFIYEGSPEQKALKEIAPDVPQAVEEEYMNAIAAVHNEDECPETLAQYAEAVRKIYGFPSRKENVNSQ